MSERLAVIVANSEFHDTRLTRIATPTRDAEALAEVLTDSAIGDFVVTLLVNKPLRVVRREVARLYERRKRDDLLVFYYSGHGIKDDYGELYLAVRDTETDSFSATALDAAFVRAQLDRSSSQRKVVLLDCCHSGAFLSGAKSARGTTVGTQEAFTGRGYGRVILTASNAVEYAWEGDKLIGEAETSVFTHFLIQGLRTGDADLDGDGEITLTELYEYVYQQILTSGLTKQTPQMWAQKVEGQIIIGRSVFPVRPREEEAEQPGPSGADGLYEQVLRPEPAPLREQPPDERPERRPRIVRGPRWAWAAGGIALLAILILGVWFLARGKQGTATPGVMPPVVTATPRTTSTLGAMAPIATVTPQVTSAPGATATSISVTTAAPKAIQFYSSGKRYEEDGQYDLAIAEFTKAIRLDPTKAKYYRSRGESFHRNGDFDLAIADLTKAIELEPANPDLIESRGWSYMDNGDYDLAIADFSRCIELNPNYAYYYYARGKSYHLAASYKHPVGDYELAIADLDKAVQLDPTRAVYYTERGDSYLGAAIDDHPVGDYELAIADLDKAIELEPTSGYNYLCRGEVFHQKGDYDQAIADRTTAIELDPTNASFYAERGWSHQDNGDFDLAIADFSKAIELDPTNAGNYYNRGQSYHVAAWNHHPAGDYDLAIADFTKAIELEPANEHTYGFRGWSHKENGDYDLAIADLDRAIELDPNNGGFYYTRSLAYRAKGDTARADADLNKARELGYED